jgi:hypothetical protein
MNLIGLILGLIAFFWMGITLIPLLGWLNWLNIPFAVVGLIVSILGFLRRRSSLGLTGIILCSAAMQRRYTDRGLTAKSGRRNYLEL